MSANGPQPSFDRRLLVRLQQTLLRRVIGYFVIIATQVRLLGKADLGVDSQVSYKFHTDRLVGSVEPKSRFAEKADIAPCARHTT